MDRSNNRSRVSLSEVEDKDSKATGMLLLIVLTDCQDLPLWPGTSW